MHFGNMLFIVLMQSNILRVCLASLQISLPRNIIAEGVMRKYWGVGDPSHYYWLKFGAFDRLIN